MRLSGHEELRLLLLGPSVIFYCGYSCLKILWNTVDLQCCVNFRYIAEWFSYTHTHTHIYSFLTFSSIIGSYGTLSIVPFALKYVLVGYIFDILVQFSSIAQSCPTLCDPMNCSMPGLPVHHQLPEFTQTHVRQVDDASQPSHPLSSPSPPAPKASQHQGLLQYSNVGILGFPVLTGGKDPSCPCRTLERGSFTSWVGRMPWRRAGQPTPVCVPGESPGQRSLADCGPWCRKEPDMTAVT